MRQWPLSLLVGTIGATETSAPYRSSNSGKSGGRPPIVVAVGEIRLEHGLRIDLTSLVEPRYDGLGSDLFG